MALTHNTSKVIQKLISDLQLGTLPSASGKWPTHVSQEQDEPDETITIYDIDPTDLGTDMLRCSDVSLPGIQIRVRAKDNSGLKARLIAEALHEVENVSVGVGDSSYIVRVLHRELGPNYLGKSVTSPSELFLFTINYSVSLKEN